MSLDIGTTIEQAWPYYDRFRAEKPEDLVYVPRLIFQALVAHALTTSELHVHQCPCDSCVELRKEPLSE